MQDFLTFVLIFSAAQLIIDRNDVTLYFRKGLAVTDDFSRLDSLKHLGIAFQEEMIGVIAGPLSLKNGGKTKKNRQRPFWTLPVLLVIHWGFEPQTL